MICPHCHSKIPDGSNICPMCFSSLNGVSRTDEDVPSTESTSAPRVQQTAKKKSSGTRSSSRSKSRRSKRRNRAPLVIAIILIVILLVIVVLIIRSMFFGGSILPFLNSNPSGNEPTAPPEPAVTSNFIVYTNETAAAATDTPEPMVEITPTPEPTPEAVERTYTTLKKNDTGSDVVTLQQALAELGFLNSAADGIYGTGTMTAVKAFQTQYGLDADGIAGPKTQELLYSLVTPRPQTTSTAAPGEILDLPG